MKFLRLKFQEFFEWLARLTYIHRFKTLFCVALLFALLATNLSKLTINVTTEGFLHQNDPKLIVYKNYKKEFGNDEVIIVGIQTKNIFDINFLTKLKSLHNEIEDNVPYIDDITSLVNVRNTMGIEDELLVEDLLRKLPENIQDMDMVKNKVETCPFYKNLVISEDEKTTTIIIKLLTYKSAIKDNEILEGFESNGNEHEFISVKETGQAVEKIAKIIEKYNSQDFEVMLSGSSSVEHYLKKIVAKNARKFLGLAYLTASICLVFMFKKISGVILPLIVISLTLISSLSSMGLAGVAIKFPTQVLPAFILAVSVGYSVHILALFFYMLKRTSDKLISISYAMKHSGFAIFITALTTAAGLFSFSTSEVAPVGELGVFSGLAVFYAMFYTYVVLPPLLSFTFVRKTNINNKIKTQRSLFDSMLLMFARISTKRPGLILIILSVVFLLACIEISKIKFSHNILTWIPAQEKIRTDTEKLDKDMKGTVAMEVVLDTKKKNGLYDHMLLKQIEKATEKIELLKRGDVATGKIWSIIDIIKETNQALNENRQEYYSIPEENNLLAQELLLFESSGSDDMEDVTDSQFSKARISVKLPFVDAIEYKKYIASVEKILKDNVPNVSFESTGMIMIYSQVIANAISSLAKSYIYALTSITILMIIIVGRFKLGIISMIPNLFPIFLTLSIIGYFDVPMNLFVMLVGNIAIGLAVDDTIHFLNNFNNYYEEHKNVYMAIEKTFLLVGRAMFITSIVLSSGFFIYMFSEMNNLKQFGTLTGVAIILALLSDFIMTPALLTLIFRKKQI